MFQYALYRRLHLDGKDVALDISAFDNYELHNGFEVGRIFGFNLNIADISVVNGIKLKVFHATIIQKIIWKIFSSRPIIVQNKFDFHDEYLSFRKPKYLEGYWQTEKYFGIHSDTIRNDFKFPQLDLLNKEYADKIQHAESVSVHIRMGDYINHPLHGGICTLEYYENAIALIKVKVENPLFFIFSNDIEWCKNNLKLDNAIYITGNDGENSFRDMQLMSMCKHNIIANSSFSWWGAWLNNNSDKIVIAPSKWFNDPTINTKDLIPDSWIQI
jgi:hypothetical protein